MADTNNFSEINENFDTIKTLLNSIRAQGILNTSDVDRLLGGINSKLEKINTDEDIVRIKTFLTELKQNLDERHSVLISKFGAIESLFSNLLKNSADMLKTSEVKELFDIVATNLSVFSREVVSQKDSLSEISLRLDAIQSDDTKKQEIIQNVHSLKGEIERIGNGFDSIVLNLNDNFKTVIKDISELDKTDSLTEFGAQITDIMNSSNTILSALQLLDKKSAQLDDTISTLATQDDISSTKKSLNELFAINKQVSDSVESLVDKNYKLDNLADKIDASVSIIAGLKSAISENSEGISLSINDRLAEIESQIKEASSPEKYDDIKSRLEEVLKDVIDNCVLNFSQTSTDIKEHFKSQTERMSQIVEDSLSKTLNDITSNAESLNAKIRDTHNEISELCQKNFSEVVDSISALKTAVNQIDENNVSSNNAVFSNITDRLAIFENSLKNSLEKQEDYVSNSSNQVIDKLTGMQNLSDSLDYKLDSSIIELNNSKKEFEELKNSVQSVLDLDFVNTVKDLRTDLYAVKQDLADALENSSSEVNEKLSNDLFSKYELLVSKLENVEDEVQKVQQSSLEELKNSLDKISYGIMDILSYVSSNNESKNELIDSKIEEISKSINDSHLNYVENVRNIVDVVKIQVENNLKQMSIDTVSSVEASNDSLKAGFEASLSSLRNAFIQKIDEFKNDFTCENADKISELRFNSENLHAKAIQNSLDMKEDLKSEIENITDSLKMCVSNLDVSVNKLSNETSTALTSTLAKILDNFVSLKGVINSFGEKTEADWKNSVDEIKDDFENLKNELKSFDKSVDDDLSRQVSILENSFGELNNLVSTLFEEHKNTIGDRMNVEFETMQNKIDAAIKENSESLHNILNNTLEKQNSISEAKIADISNSLKTALSDSIELSSADYTSLKEKLDDFSSQLEKENITLVSGIKNQLDDITKFVDSGLSIQAQEVNSAFEQINSKMNTVSTSVIGINEDIKSRISAINDDLKLAQENNKSSLDETSGLILSSLESLINDLKANSESILNANFDAVTALVEKSTEVAQNSYSVHAKSVIKDLNELKGSSIEQFNALKEIVKNEIEPDIINLETKINSLFEHNSLDLLTQISNSSTSVCEEMKVNAKNIKDAFIQLNEKLDKDGISLINVYQAQLKDLGENFNVLIAETKDAIRMEIGAISHALIESSKAAMKDASSSMENSLIEQVELLKSNQKDELANMTAQIEDSVADYISDSVNELKSYLDIRTDNTVMSTKFESLSDSLTETSESVLDSLNKLVELSVFSDAIADLKSANSAIAESMAEKLNEQIEDFIKINVTQNISDKLNLFDKKFIDTVVDKYEEVRLNISHNNDSIEKISNAVNQLISEFEESQHYVDELKESFADLKAQILNKSFDEAFQASLNNQITGIEKIIDNQTRYLENIEDLCCENLPEISEMSVILKHNIQKSIEDLASKFDLGNVDIGKELDTLKTDIITQMINMFNQISFVTEQEEILDYIQEKHEELITILSHIVTTSDGIETVKDNLAVVDNKMNSLREDIDLINEKITSIMSSDGDIDYVYSLQDLETDIANLRLVLNEMKEDNRYKEFHDDFETLSEDIVSISTRTNKLILASDESYKTLQENLQEFKLVINDLDERTRNFAREAGIERIDNKLGAINTMIQNGAKTNQVFNQVFEYLAEWVDKAGAQISSISDKVETLDDIGQIKVMLEDLKAESEDNSENNELIEALGNVFEKQAKRISSLESKLDRIIVENTINNKVPKLDVTPFEDTLNKFLVAIDDKMNSQQNKINSLEKRLEEILSIAENKDTAQLTKKVGGMDRQIAKLNKSIEKIASHVVEK